MIIKRFTILFAILSIYLIALNAFGQNNLIQVYDARYDQMIWKQKERGTEADKQLVELEVKKNQAFIKQLAKKPCNTDRSNGVLIHDIISGSFTKADSSQKLILFDSYFPEQNLCSGGIMLVEDGNIVAYYQREISWNAGLFTLADINKNGLPEIVLHEQKPKMREDVSGTEIEIFELKNNEISSFGTTLVESRNHSGKVRKDSFLFYNISAQKSDEPVFFRDAYHNESSEKPVNKTKERFSLTKNASNKFVPIIKSI